MKLALIVLAHHRPAQLVTLLSKLRHQDTRLYLHVDRTSKIAPFEHELAQSEIDDVELLPRHDSRWGGIGPVDAALHGLARSVADQCDYFILLSGQDLPMWPIGQIVEFFADHRDTSYLSHFSLPDPRWDFDGRMRTDFYTYNLLGRRETCFPKGVDVRLSLRGRLLNAILRLWIAHKPDRRFPEYIRPFGGSQWWNLSRDAAEFVLQFIQDHPDYRTYHLHTLLPDEIFFNSVLAGTDFQRFHTIVNDSLRYMIWRDNGSHPETLGSQDLPGALKSGKPFARKFDIELDPSVVEELPV